MSSALQPAPSEAPSAGTRAALLCATFFVAFVALDIQSRGIERMHGVAAFFPADGLALAFLCVVGPRFVPSSEACPWTWRCSG